MADPNTGMPKAEMKKLLRRSFGEGMGCAVAVGENPAFGLFMMHRVRRGKAMEKMLKDKFPDAKTIRFGTAFVKEEEPKKVYLSLNRAAPGIARRLVKTFKGTGFTKVSIVSDDGVNEDHEEADETAEIADDEEGLAAAPVAAQSQPEAAPDAAPPPPAPAAEPVNGAALAKRLAGLIPRIAGASGSDPALAARLGKLAKDAGVNIKTGNLNYGALYVQQLETELDGASPAPAAAAPTKGALGSRLSSLISELGKLPASDHKAALTRMAALAGGQIKAESLPLAAETLARLERALSAPPPPSGAAARLVKLRVDWTGVRDAVAADVETLAKALADTYAGQPLAKQVTDRFKAKADPILSRLDGRLGIAIDGIVNASDAAARAQATAAARAILGEFQAAAADPFIGDLDANPFVPLSIRSKTTAALAAVAAALQPS